MGEMFQARVDDDFAEKVHDYKDERFMSKSEVVRKALRELVRDEGNLELGDLVDEEPDEEEQRVKQLARVGEKVALIGVAFTFLSVLSGILLLTVTTGGVGTWLLSRAVYVFFILGAACVVASFVLIIEGLIRYGIYTGIVGRTVARVASIGGTAA